MIGRWIVFALMSSIIGLTGCSRNFSTPLGGGQQRPTFDGATFRANASRVDRSDISYFTSTVAPVSRTLDGARAAAEYEGVRYCIENFGTSRIKWSVGPETEAAALPIEKDRLVYQGRCQR